MPEKTDKLRQEILADAERKAERTMKRAQRDADKLREETKKQNEKMRARRIAEAKRQAEGRARAIVAGIPYEERRIKLLAQEQVFDEVFNASLRKLREDTASIDREVSLKQLLAEALSAMPDDGEVNVYVKQDDRKAAEKALADTTNGAHASLEADSRSDGGVVVSDASGRMRFDNSYASRFAREKDQLRAEISKILASYSTSKEEQENDA